MLRGESYADDLSAHDVIYIMKNEVDIWPRLYRDLAKCEQDQVDRFIFNKDKARYTVSHWFMRRILADHLGCTGSELVFSQGSHGKPYLGGQSGLFFNLSHCDECSVLIVSRYGEVGVDVESSQRMSVGEIDALKLAVLTHAERERLDRLPVDQLCECFIRFWTLKEAYLKQKGWGLHYELDKLSFSLDEPISVKVDGSQDCDINLGSILEQGLLVSWATFNRADPLIRHIELPIKVESCA
ncbi:4'-phosphopantetheinyl transferase family protein [Photobacterium gaetbulicola]|uniref:4'-phosphopantetheinyl transferase family protein n=1 Tax=Photobacterium gaetbulicola TaxID=1295392 RepID=UPI00068EC57C|nr:4'-phosphopantetheinyl transferase superfamily protein [Photobacterium gaetbulicola]